MNLLNTFQEIKQFFNRKNFTDHELECLLNQLKNIYSDKNIHKSALSLVKLELMKFELQVANNINNSKLIINNINYHGFVFPISLSDFAQKLEISENYVLALLKQNFINQNKDDLIGEAEYNALRPFVDSRLGSIKRKSRQIETFEMNLKKSKIKRSSNSPGVYGEIEKYGIGKIIYIRKK